MCKLTKRRSGWTVQAAVYAIGDISHQTVLSSGQSDEFNIVPGGPDPQVSVTVINKSVLSTMGGTTFTAFTPGVDQATTSTKIAATTTTGTRSTTTGHTTSKTSSSTAGYPSNSATETSQLANSSTASPDSGLSTGTTIGIAIGVVLAVLFLTALGGLYFLSKRRKKSQKLVDDQVIPLEEPVNDKIPSAIRYIDEDDVQEILSGRLNNPVPGGGQEVFSGRLNTEFKRKPSISD